MNVRWNAVLLGVAADFCLTLLIQGLALALGLSAALERPSLLRPADLGLLALGVLATAVGGYVAGAVARESQVFNGFMVGVVDIVLLAMLNANLDGSPAARIYVLTQLMGCLMGALGGYLSQVRAALR